MAGGSASWPRQQLTQGELNLATSGWVGGLPFPTGAVIDAYLRGGAALGEVMTMGAYIR